ncbi:hypothetical protein SPRG_09163 [Saprolegnia parasitica CBS 223.65]|uniref:PDZ domain-containing protein n=1 Tax=Saprolegnia parasitica (strain CBS 223.65) TaxID=695850 RepID=A0A067C4A0_SAPPC|nr:hypothetical protein SPRG_09163 [Saprolegnia parasitica CBS 223.65]KDO25338.1 hypothetical protein SPRG_09163 [Saprolegnia parasitica CBS 223.65]|eukprot:XP_012203988.1 hypothetical protein SPRG_09163 [Saprolegnia parasitica CBS 223.65]
MSEALTHVEWVTGALGVFVISNRAGFAVVSKLTTPLPAHFKTPIAVGDILIALNDTPVTPTFATTLQALRTKASGTLLRLTFQSRRHDIPQCDALGNECHELLWAEDAPLGLSFVMEPCSLLTVVSKSIHEAPPDVGDILVAIGDVDTSGMRFEHVMATLSKVARPVTLRFVSSLMPAASAPLSDDEASSPVTTSSSMTSLTSKLPGLRRGPGHVVYFTGGRLGLAFKIKAYPTVSQLLDTTLHDGLDDVLIGDQLVSINGESTQRWSMEHVIDRIQSHDNATTAPLELLFVTPAAAPPAPPRQLPSNCYEVVYHGGKLGVVLVGRKGATEIEDVTDPTSAPGLEKALAGDRLVAIDGQRTNDMAFDKTIERVKQAAAKPGGARLLFFRPENAFGEEVPFGLFLLTAIEALLI